MAEQIYIGNFAKGLKLDKKAFNIDNDAFNTLFNFYVWRGQVKRKRGTVLLGRLQIQVISVLVPTTQWQDGPIVLVAGSANLITSLSLGSSASITPRTINVQVNGFTYTEPSVPNGTLLKNGAVDPGSTINYGNGVITISGGGVGPLTGRFDYYPGNPVMGLRDFVPKPSVVTDVTNDSLYPLLIAFDTTNSYQINQSVSPPTFYNVNYYKSLNGVKSTPFFWSGFDFQQFWTINYSGALWATNNKPGFNFVNGTASPQAGLVIQFTFTSQGVPFQTLVVGDSLWFNEWAGGSTINNVTGSINPGGVINAALGIYNVSFSNAQTVTGTGIAQLLISTVAGQDGIKWYDGDPTSQTGLPTLNGLGWVNFSPPLTANIVSINNIPAAKYYLVGALMIVPFKDRLLFLSPYVQTSIPGATPIQLQDTVIFSWNGTPYYNNNPAGQTSNIIAYYVDQTGAGGWQSAGIAQPIMTMVPNEDVLLIGFGGKGRKTRFVYTGNDLQPFNFYTINSELPSSATFSSIALDKGGIDLGPKGICLTDQQSSERIDLDIPDSVFQIQSLQNGIQRVNAIRDYFKEWIYFSYPITDIFYDNKVICKFPLQTFLFNYRDNTWAIFYENFTAHGNYLQQTKRNWKTTGFKSWSVWREPWSSGSNTANFPDVISGNPQGFVLILDKGTGEAQSGNIASISNNGGFTQISSINHCVSAKNPSIRSGDYLLIQGAVGLLSSSITAITLGTQTVLTSVNTFVLGSFITLTGIMGTVQLNNKSYQIIAVSGTSITINVDSTSFNAYVSGGIATISFNGQIGKVIRTQDANTFVVDIPFPSGTYMGLGTFARLSQPLLQTKQFPVYWDQGRKCRLSVQKYLMDKTFNSQVTVNVYLSQDAVDPWNELDLDPAPNSLIYSQLMYTCPESTNIGLTAANTNLQMPTAESQQQIWHRFSTSLIGDSVQIGITLNDFQMRNLEYATDEITLHGMHLTTEIGPQLS